MTTPLDAAKLPGMLLKLGVLVTLGGASTPAIVAAADGEQLRAEGGPVALVGRAILVKIQYGTLPGLASNATIIVTEGSLAGAYSVDRVLDVVDGEMTAFLAYPTTSQAAPAFWTQGEVLLPWALRESGAAAGAAFDLDTVLGAPVLVLESDAAAEGTDPALNVKVQDCATEDGVFADCGYAFDEIDAAGGARVLALDRDELERYIRLVPDVTGTDDPAFWCGAGVLDVAVPRS